MRERSISPVELVDGSLEDSSMENALPEVTSLEPQLLCEESDYSDKCLFLAKLELTSLAAERRKGW